MLEQKLKKVTDEIGYKSNTKYKVYKKTIENTQLLLFRTFVVGKKAQSTTL